MRVLFYILSLSIGSISSQQIPDYIIPCVKTSANFRQCSIENGRKAIPYILKGDKASKIPPLSPLRVPRVSIRSNDNLRITINDLEIYGIDTARLEDVVFDFEGNTIRVSLVMEYLTVLGRYQIDGRLLIPLRGSGSCNITAVNSHVDYVMDFKVVEKGGKDYIEVDKDKLTMRNERQFYLLENLFGNKQLSDETNRILNENYREVGQELNGPVTETIRTIVTELIKNYLTRFPIDEIFLKE